MLGWNELLSIEIVTLFTFVLSFTITYLAVPRIIYVVEEKNLMDSPNSRSSHDKKTPTLGGVAFFLTLIVSLFILECYDVNGVGGSIAAGLAILFFIGLKDDLVALSPKTKIISQIVTTLILLVNIGLHTQSFGGFLGINTIPNWLAIIFGCFIVLSIINSYNLIDGINGSASMVGIVIFSSFAYIFFRADFYYYFLLSVVCIAFLFAFLRYNLSKDKKIFMGDTGSMIVGFVIGLLTLKFFALSPEQLSDAGIIPINKFTVIISLLFIPFVDTARVFTIRILKHGKPFKPDRNHVHHVMIDYMKLSHPKASLLLAFINLSSFVVILLFNNFLPVWSLFSLLLFMVLSFSVLLFYFNRSYQTRKKKQKIRKAIIKSQSNSFFFF